MQRTVQWAPPVSRIACYLGASLVIMIFASWGFGLDKGGRLLVGVVAVGLFALAVRDALVRPIVRADSGGLEIRDGLGRHSLPWAAVRSVKAEKIYHNRRLVIVDTLEVDTIDGLFVLSRRQLGSPPADVAATLEELRLADF